MKRQRDERPVVVGVDGSAAALRAVRWAADEAARLGAPLRLVHAYQWPYVRRVQDADLDVGEREFLLAQVRGYLGEAEQVARERTPEVALNTEHQLAHPVELLVRESASARLVVVGAFGLGGFAGMLLGSVAAAVAAHAHCPVVVLRRGTGASPDGPIVVGVDGSAVSEAALAFAYDAADARRVELVAVHAWRDFAMDHGVGVVFDWEAREAEEELTLAERLAGWTEKYPDVVVRRAIVWHRATPALLKQADGAQLLVVGSRGRGEFAGLLLGSTSRALIDHAPCPVAIVRPASHA